MRMHKIIIPIFLLCFTSVFTLTAYSEEDRFYKIQKKRLQNPSKIVKKAEALRQSIFIYDGLKEEDVDSAMDSQFSRIENMMFIRTRITTEAGEEEVQEEGCD